MIRFWLHKSLVLITISFSGFTVGTAPPVQAELLLSDAAIKKILRHGPWPPPRSPDFSNRVSGSPDAVILGRKLFFNTRLSRNGKIACATCHKPKLGWTDGRKKAVGLAGLDRNSQSLFNVRHNRWFGLDGRTDSLWAHSIGPILDPREMGASAKYVASRVASEPGLAQLYSKTFGRPPDLKTPVTVLVNVAKAMAAFQETIVTGKTRFDRFRDALAKGDLETAKTYPHDAQRGAALFVGRGKCNFCHTGPLFSNGEFADAGVPYFTGPGRVDPGRHGGIRKLKASPYNLTGRFNDLPARASAWATRQVAQSHKTFGEFKVPSLRELTRTAPYMHDGSLATLEDVVRHYSTIDLERLHTDGEKILFPLNLSRREASDLVAFLKTLSVSKPD